MKTMKKTLLQQEIKTQREKAWRFTLTSAWDSGIRDVWHEGYIAGLEKAQRLVRKQERIERK